MDHIFVHLVDGFEEIEALATVDILRRAELKVSTVSLSNEKTVTGSHDIPVVADFTFDEMDYSEATMLLLPGGPGTKNYFEHKGLCYMLTSFAQENKWLAAICAAPSVLGRLGLLSGRNAVCFPGFEEKLTGANVLEIPAVTDGNVITGRGAGATFEFALEIVKQLKEESLAIELAQKMVMS